MAKRGSLKCAKCGIRSNENPSLTFHRFSRPSMHGSLKAKVRAEFCFPDNDWSHDESLVKLHAEHKMLCGNHFDVSSYTSSDRKRLNKFAIPTEAQNILSQLRDEQCKAPQHQEFTVKMKMEASASTSKSIEDSHTQLHGHLETPDISKHRESTVIIKMEASASTSKSIEDSHTQLHGYLESPGITKHRESTVKMKMEASATTSKSIEDSHTQLHGHLESPDITKVLSACFYAGLEVLGVVCDLDGINIRACVETLRHLRIFCVSPCLLLLYCFLEDHHQIVEDVLQRQEPVIFW